MPFDWSAFWPVIIFIPFFVMIVVYGRRFNPITRAQRRRTLVISSIGSVVAAAVAVGLLSQMVARSQDAPPAPGLTRPARVLPTAPAAPPPARMPQPR